MYADHYAAECVLVGGARRAARMATKSWRDDGAGLHPAQARRLPLELEQLGDHRRRVPHGRVKVRRLMLKGNLRCAGFTLAISETEAHAYRVLQRRSPRLPTTTAPASRASSTDRLTSRTTKVWSNTRRHVRRIAKFKLDPETLPLMQALAKQAMSMGYKVITNPCGEIVLLCSAAIASSPTWCRSMRRTTTTPKTPSAPRRVRSDSHEPDGLPLQAARFGAPTASASA
jgi:hypothetical protein